MHIEGDSNSFTFSFAIVNETTVEYQLDLTFEKESELPKDNFSTVEINRFRIRETDEVWTEVYVNGTQIIQEKSLNTPNKDITITGRGCEFVFKNLLVKRLN